MDCDVLTLAGLWNSGPDHWQSHWERRHAGWTRVRHRDYNNPDCYEWVAELDGAIAQCDGPPVLAAHSLACALVAHWVLSASPLRIAGALLVAPGDVEMAGFPAEAVGFAPMPMGRLPFPSIVVASANDAYVALQRAQAFAHAWGSKLVVIGDAGHVNAASGFGEWAEGEKMVLELCG